MAKLKAIHKSQGGLVLMALLAVLTALGALGALSWVVWDLVNPGTGSIPELPDRVVGESWDSFCCISDSGTPASQLNAYWGVVFEPAETMRLTDFEYRCGRSGSGDKELSARVYLLDASPDALGTFLGESEVKTWGEIQASPGTNQVQPWNTWHFDETIYLYAGTEYVIRIYLHDGSSGSLVCTIPYGTACIGAVTKGYWYATAGGGWSSSADSDYCCKGYTSIEPEVHTTGHAINADGSVSLQGWADNVGNLELGFLCSDDYDQVVAGAGTEYVWGTSGWDYQRVPFDYRLVWLVNGQEYYYRAYASAYSQTWYGSVLNFTRNADDVPIGLDCNVIVNNMDGVTFESSVVGINSSLGVTYNLSIDYGQDISECQSSNGTLAVALNVTEDGVWRTLSTTGSDFEGGEKYYYRLVAAGNDSSFSYSDTRTFIAYDPESPGIINWFSNLVGLSTGNFWWIIIALLFALVWILAGVLRWKWVGVIGSAVIFVALVTLGIVNPWVVVLVCLVAGWIVFKLVFHRAGATGGKT